MPRSAPGLRAAAALLAACAACASAPPAPRAAQPADLRTERGEIVARQPQGDDWVCEASTRTGEGFRLAEVKCRSEGVALYARDYAGPDDDVEAICKKDWKATYAPLFGRLARTSTRFERLGARWACAVTVEGEGRDGGGQRIEEWYAVEPGHVLLVTAAGSTARVDAALVRAWREGVVFRPRAP